MPLFQPATNGQAFLKMGLMGFAGDGKTYTATQVAIGMVQLMRKRGLDLGNRPAFFIDTETGSDWVKPRFDEADLSLMVAKTRSFVDLLEAVDVAEREGSVLLIDSISHFWRVLCDEYAQKRNRKRGLEFSDWAWLKGEWSKFTDRFVNSQCHIIMCGRAGFEYDFFEDDAGKKQLEKTGIKMKAEAETGYEPSILVLMEKHQALDGNRVWRTATVLKDRSTKIDGKTFENPTFKDFLPHIEYLNLGGQHFSVDTGRDNSALFADDGTPRWMQERRAKEIALDEITEVLNKHHGGTTQDAKRAKADWLEKAFSSRSWERIQSLDWPTVRAGRNFLWLQLEGVEYSYQPPDHEKRPEEELSDVPA
ncbi:AAA family ATPase [Roseateles sp. BYS96W]|uniref:AAA family ATPase n=1 Tax=Pelomonas nitida TaxID=3299027 RepID=A0ABW7G7F7_9BURK